MLDESSNDTYDSLIVKEDDYVERMQEEWRYYVKKYQQGGELAMEWLAQAQRVSEEIKKYPKFGHPAIDYGNYRRIKALKKTLDERFSRKYGRQRLAFSSPEVFTAEVQNIFDDVAETMEQKLKYKEIILQKFENVEYGNKVVSTFNNSGGTTDRAKDLPDYNSAPNLAHLQSTNTRNDHGSSATIDDTIQTQLNNILTLSGVDLNIITSYINSFGHLFQSVLY